MSDDSLISIIVPVYNTEQYLRRCLDSIIHQVYDNLEIIVVDDGSKDGCGAICDEYAQKDSRIKVIHQANAGQSRARNVGLDIAQGAYIGFVDSDDWILPQMFEKLMDIALATDSDIVNCGVQRQVESGEIVSRYDHFPLQESDGEMGMRLALLGKIPVAPWNKLFKRKIFDGIRFPEGMFFEDEYIMPYLFDKAKKITYLDEQLYTYNEHIGSTIHSSFGKADLDRLIAQHNHIIAFSHRFSDLAIQLKQRYYMACADVFGKALIHNASEEVKRDIYRQMKSHLKDVLPELRRGNWLEACIAKSGYFFYAAYRKLRMNYCNHGKDK